MKAKNCVALLQVWFCVVLAVSEFGCGSGSASVPPVPITVSVSPTSATVRANGTQSFMATVANDSANKGVTWTVSCSTAQISAALST